MKRFIKAFTLVIIISIICTNVTFGGLADWTREEADKQAEQELQEQNERENERKGKSDNTYLSSLSIENYEISPEFNKDIANYKIEEEISENKIMINATAEDNKSTIDGAGEVILNTGINNIEIQVTAENGFSRVYYIIVTKKEKKEANKLNNITVSALEKGNSYKLELSPKFDSNVYSYTCDVKNKIDKIAIDCETDSNQDHIKITGNYDLPEEENVFTIIVGEEGQESVYKIVVYNKALNATIVTLENNKKDEIKYNFIIMAIVAILIIVIASIIILFNKKTIHQAKH